MRRTRKSRRSETLPAILRGASEFDREFVIDAFQPPDTESTRLWRRVQRKRGRPKVGRGVKIISVSIERKLPKQADQLAKKQRVSRAHLIGRGLRAVLAAEVAHSRSRPMGLAEEAHMARTVWPDESGP